MSRNKKETKKGVLMLVEAKFPFPTTDHPPKWLHYSFRKYWRQFMKETVGGMPRERRVKQSGKSATIWGDTINEFRLWLMDTYGFMAPKGAGKLLKPLTRQLKMKKVAEDRNRQIASRLIRLAKNLSQKEFMDKRVKDAYKEIEKEQNQKFSDMTDAQINKWLKLWEEKDPKSFYKPYTDKGMKEKEIKDKSYGYWRMNLRHMPAEDQRKILVILHKYRVWKHGK